MSLTTIATVAEEARHGALEIVHAKIFVPKPKPVIELTGESELVIVPLPEIKVQTPVPTVTVFAVITVVGEEIQSVCVAPAFETVGILLTITATVEEEGEHGEFEMVHAKTFVPIAKPVIELVGESEFVIVPAPATKVQTPVPTVAVFAVIIVVGEEMQSV